MIRDPKTPANMYPSLSQAIPQMWSKDEPHRQNQKSTEMCPCEHRQFLLGGTQSTESEGYEEMFGNLLVYALSDTDYREATSESS